MEESKAKITRSKKKVEVNVPQPKKITSKIAFEAYGGNKRLISYVEKKYKGVDTFEEWKKKFDAEELK